MVDLQAWAMHEGEFHTHLAWLLHPYDAWVANPHYRGVPVPHPEADTGVEEFPEYP